MDHYSTPFSVTSQFAFCGLPLRLDAYRGCGFQCSYCFARNRGGNGPGDAVRPADPSQITRILEYALDGRTDGVIAEFLRHRTPVHFGGMSDPFQPAEERYRVTASVLKTLARYQYPTVLSTRGGLVAEQPYVDLLRDLGNVVVQFSFSTSRDAVASCIEPYSTSPSGLLRAMEKLSSFGVAVTCRWQPYIPGISEKPEEFVARIANTGCRHVGFEHLKLPVEQGKPLWQEFVAVARRDFHGSIVRQVQLEMAARSSCRPNENSREFLKRVVRCIEWV
jgi:DNA repair photolyase